jgi:hypothetical protein
MMAANREPPIDPGSGHRDFALKQALVARRRHHVGVPVLLGSGVRLWAGQEGIEKNDKVEATSAPSGVTHVTFTRAREHISTRRIAADRILCKAARLSKRI